MPIPDLYKWVESVSNQPKMVAEAIKLIGIKEYPGIAHNNPVIMSMAAELGIVKLYPNDETPWCAVVHNWICLKTEKPLSGKGYDLLRAKSFMSWGEHSTIPMYGDTGVFKRDGGHHVGIILAEDLTHYHVAGGNQRNSYSIMRLEKGRIVACRRLYKTGPPSSVKQIIVAPNGVISNNEA